MNASCMFEDIAPDRRRFFCTAALGIAATAGAFSPLPARLHWLTNAAISSARFYRNKINLYNAANVSLPAAVSVFPGENYEARGVGQGRRITTSSTITRWTGTSTTRPGTSHNSFAKRFAPASDHFASRSKGFGAWKMRAPATDSDAISETHGRRR